jgi:hypothetical protein
LSRYRDFSGFGDLKLRLAFRSDLAFDPTLSQHIRYRPFSGRLKDRLWHPLAMPDHLNRRRPVRHVFV